MCIRVVAALPNAGLGNKLFVWAKAEVFAALNGGQLGVVGWTYPKIGPLLRGERSCRVYQSLFRSSALTATSQLVFGYVSGRLVREPPCRRLEQIDADAKYVFSEVPHWADMFADIREHRSLVIQRLQETIRSQHLKTLDRLSKPVVALHIRRGDFRPLAANEDFAQVGGVRTPDDYFLRQVRQLRAAAQQNVPITLFSDGSDEELSGILAEPNISRSAASNDLLDLLLMARARVIICSAGSSFSAWAGFLSEGMVLRHPNHINGRIRPASSHSGLEGPAPCTAAEWRELWRIVSERMALGYEDNAL